MDSTHELRLLDLRLLLWCHDVHNLPLMLELRHLLWELLLHLLWTSNVHELLLVALMILMGGGGLHYHHRLLMMLWLLVRW